MPLVARGQEPLDPSQFADPTTLLGFDIVSPIVKSIGLTTAHRAYEPATSLGTFVGLDMGVEVTLAKLPEDFATALTQAGSPGASNIPFLPVPRINLHKGLGPKAELGLSGILYRSYRIIGLEAKFVIAQPEEGPTWAFRMNYTSCILTVPDTVTLELSTKTFEPEIVVSRRLDWAEPYIGIGYMAAIGTLKITVDLPDPLPDQESSATGRGGGFLAFTGVGLRAPALGLKLTLEGSYSTEDAHTLGVKFGFNL